MAARALQIMRHAARIETLRTEVAQANDRTQTKRSSRQGKAMPTRHRIRAARSPDRSPTRPLGIQTCAHKYTTH
eukprot:2299816-Alexandrium_andersonii.AAC.1